MWHDERLLLDGELVAAEGNRTYETENPSTGEVLGVAADATDADADLLDRGRPRWRAACAWARSA